jgi:ssDNA-binding Zn-finger/Zn-ribbon topoisomerase 1
MYQVLVLTFEEQARLKSGDRLELNSSMALQFETRLSRARANGIMLNGAEEEKPEKPLTPCEICGKSYKVIKQHIALKHPITSAKEKPQAGFPCPDCGRMFQTYQARNSHTQVHKHKKRGTA